jgi:hypothetical protein
MSSTNPQTITVDGITLTLLIERKRVKNINARLRESTLSISVPLQTPQATLDQVIPDLARRLVRRVRARQVNAEEDALALAHKVAARFPNRPGVAHVEFVTTQQARWGSYSSATRTIRLNAALREMPRWVLEAVVAHELAHVTHHDHGAGFWKLLRSVYFLPSLVSPVIVGSLFVYILAYEGLFNASLKLVGLKELAIDWLGDPQQQVTLPNFGLRPATTEPTQANDLFRVAIQYGISFTPDYGQAVQAPAVNDVKGLIQWVTNNP